MPRPALAALLGSAALLLAALGFQYLDGLAPCKLCLWQRWPHVIAIALGFLLLATRWRPAAGLAALALTIGAGIALYHAGIEQGWWPGPDTCSSQPISGLSTEDLLARITAAPVTRCDEIAWSVLGLSMAAWNGIASLALAALWLLALRHSPRW